MQLAHNLNLRYCDQQKLRLLKSCQMNTYQFTLFHYPY